MEKERRRLGQTLNAIEGMGQVSGRSSLVQVVEVLPLDDESFTVIVGHSLYTEKAGLAGRLEEMKEDRRSRFDEEFVECGMR